MSSPGYRNTATARVFVSKNKETMDSLEVNPSAYLQDDPFDLANTFVSLDRKSTRLNSSHVSESRMPYSA